MATVHFSRFGEVQVYLPFLASCAVCALLALVYWRLRWRRRGAGSKAAAPPRSSSHELSPRSSAVERSVAVPQVLHGAGGGSDAWGPMVAHGIDVGSFTFKGHTLRDGRLQEIPPLRAVVCIDEVAGAVFGDVAVALQRSDASYFALPRDMSASGASVNVRGVDFKPHHAIAGIIDTLTGNATATRVVGVVGVSLPPYMRSAAHHLYLAAHAAGCGRFFIFDQSAALLAALLRARGSEKQRTRLPRYVAFVDIGRSGIAASICEVREAAGTVLYSTHRHQKLRALEEKMVERLIADNPAAAAPSMLASLVEAALELRDEFASTKEYLAAAKRSSTVHIEQHDVTVSMDSEVFQELLQEPMREVEELASELDQWLQQNTTRADEVELVLTGGGVKLRELRWPFEKFFEPRRTSIDKVTVSQGAAILAAQQHPAYAAQRFDVTPLFLLPTVDESGLRSIQDSPRGTSVLAPLLRSGSALYQRRTPTSPGQINSPPSSPTFTSRYSLIN